MKTPSSHQPTQTSAVDVSTHESAKQRDLAGNQQLADERRKERKVARAKRREKRRQDRAAKIKAWLATTESSYSNDWTKAIGPATRALVKLNNFAKTQKCAERHREQIYKLKGRFTRMLCRRGYCHKHEHENGLIAFCFHIDGSVFNWHLPKRFVGSYLDTSGKTKACSSRQGKGPIVITQCLSPSERLLHLVLAKLESRSITFDWPHINSPDETSQTDPLGFQSDAG